MKNQNVHFKKSQGKLCDYIEKVASEKEWSISKTLNYMLEQYYLTQGVEDEKNEG